jgi:hypothetical protein
MRLPQANSRIELLACGDACISDSDEPHTRALDVVQKWFGETPTTDEILSALG